MLADIVVDRMELEHSELELFGKNKPFDIESYRQIHNALEGISPHIEHYNFAHKLEHILERQS